MPLESISPEIDDIGRVNGIAGTVANHTRVQKSGRTTGQTSGTIEGINASFTVNYREAGQALLTGLYVIKPFPGNPPFSAGGDSGSLILDNANRAVALLFAGSTLQTLAIPIRTVMEDLGLDAIL